MKTESLRQFQKRATQLTTNTLLPILTNLKLSYSGDICTLTKNNIGAVIVGQVEATGDACNILINERIFFAIVSSSKQEFIEIQVEEDRILIIESRLDELEEQPQLISEDLGLDTIHYHLESGNLKVSQQLESAFNLIKS